jgi:peptidoglycan hydrolase-like protein with peptidoglycan-binding domain
VGTTIEALAAGGIVRAGEVAELARRAGLALPAAATVLQVESGGGYNVWGHDAVDPCGAYRKGAPVTEAAYRRYLAIRGARHERSQGVGPCQLTWWGLQDLADRRGGCWRWEVNAAVGFEHLAELIRSGGVREGFRAYNGTGAAARAYADRAVGVLDGWTRRLSGASSRPMLRIGDSGESVKVLQRALGIAVDGAFGPATNVAVRAAQRRAGLDVDGVVGPATWAVLDRRAA